MRPWPKEDAVRVSARARRRMRVGSEWHLLSSSRLEQAVYEHHPSDNADANADAARHGVSLCALRNRCALPAVRTAAAVVPPPACIA